MAQIDLTSVAHFSSLYSMHSTECWLSTTSVPVCTDRPTEKSDRPVKRLIFRDTLRVYQREVLTNSGGINQSALPTCLDEPDTAEELQEISEQELKVVAKV